MNVFGKRIEKEMEKKKKNKIQTKQSMRESQFLQFIIEKRKFTTKKKYS